MEDIEKPGPKPLNESEKEALRSISEQIEKAAQNNDWETASYLRKQLNNAARLDIISSEDNINASLTPSAIKAKTGGQT